MTRQISILMSDQLNEMLKELIQLDEVQTNIAILYAKIKQKLMDAGFTREEAIQILSHQGAGLIFTRN